MDFMQRYEHTTKRMKKGWAARRQKRAETTYNLVLTVTQQTLPDVSISLALEAVDISPEAKDHTLAKIREVASQPGVKITRHVAELLGIPRTVERLIK